VTTSVTMQLKPLCPLLLLGLSQVAFAGPNGAADRYAKQLMSSFGATKRANIFGVGSLSHVRAIEAHGLSKRQTTCDTGFFACTNFAGSCCNDGTYCVMIGTAVGCCPTGKTCNSLVCQDFQTACGSDCCDKGVNCLTDSSGNQACDTSGSGGVCGGQAGFSQCTNMSGCCPDGVTCIPPDSCDIKCTTSDPVCGTSCCLGGSVCVNDSTCQAGSGGGSSSSGSFTPIGPTSGGSSATPTAQTNTTSSSSSAKTTTTKKTTTKKTTTIDSSTTPTTDSTSSTSNTPYQPTTNKVTVKTQTVTPNNAASFPTMAAMLRGGLGGIAAGFLAM